MSMENMLLDSKDHHIRVSVSLFAEGVSQAHSECEDHCSFFSKIRKKPPGKIDVFEQPEKGLTQ